MFLIDISFKGCQGRSNIVHEMSLTPHAQKDFPTTSKSEKHMQNGDAMQSCSKILLCMRCQ
jgi:hypothetical protein